MKLILKLTFIIGLALFALFNVFNARNIDRICDLTLCNVESYANPEDEKVCKWKVIDCPGIGTGDYEACLENGDGNNCSCGSVTRECPKD